MPSEAADAAPFLEADTVCSFRPHDFSDSCEIGKGKCVPSSQCLAYYRRSLGSPPTVWAAGLGALARLQLVLLDCP